MFEICNEGSWLYSASLYIPWTCLLSHVFFHNLSANWRHFLFKVLHIFSSYILLYTENRCDIFVCRVITGIWGGGGRQTNSRVHNNSEPKKKKNGLYISQMYLNLFYDVWICIVFIRILICLTVFLYKIVEISKFVINCLLSADTI